MKPCLPMLAIAGVGLSGCVGDGDATVVIIQNQAPDEGCAVASTPSDSYIGAGRLDIALGSSGYVLTPVASNEATATDEQSIDRTAFVEGIQVDLHFPGADQEELEREFWDDPEKRAYVRFEIPYAAPISPSGTTSFIAEVVPVGLVEQLSIAADDSVLIIANVRLVGHLGNGADFESANFRYPVEVCNGCLVDNLGSCGTIAEGAEIDQGGACNEFQDFPVDCCVSVNGGTICPARPE